MNELYDRLYSFLSKSLGLGWHIQFEEDKITASKGKKTYQITIKEK